MLTADQQARLVHVESEGVGVAAVVYQGHAGVESGADHLPLVGRLLCRERGEGLGAEALDGDQVVQQAQDEVLCRV